MRPFQPFRAVVSRAGHPGDRGRGPGRPPAQRPDRHPLGGSSAGRSSPAPSPKSDLLALDEPTAGVDAANQQALAHTLGALAAAGTTILLITHELGPAAPTITRTLALRDGLIVFDGAAQDVA